MRARKSPSLPDDSISPDAPLPGVSRGQLARVTNQPGVRLSLWNRARILSPMSHQERDCPERWDLSARLRVALRAVMLPRRAQWAQSWPHHVFEMGVDCI